MVRPRILQAERLKTTTVTACLKTTGCLLSSILMLSDVQMTLIVLCSSSFLISVGLIGSCVLVHFAFTIEISFEESNQDFDSDCRCLLAGEPRGFDRKCLGVIWLSEMRRVNRLPFGVSAQAEVRISEGIVKQ